MEHHQKLGSHELGCIQGLRFCTFDWTYTHVKHIQVIDMDREKGVVLLRFPTQTTHRLQLLDVGLIKSLHSKEMK